MRSRDRGVRTGQEARAHAIGDLAEPQVEARRLDLVGHEVVGGQDRARLRERRDHVVRQDAFLVDGEGKRQGAIPSDAPLTRLADDRLDGKTPAALQGSYPVVI